MSNDPTDPAIAAEWEVDRNAEYSERVAEEEYWEGVAATDHQFGSHVQISREEHAELTHGEAR